MTPKHSDSFWIMVPPTGTKMLSNLQGQTGR